jgi:hypothetical protein
MEINVQLKDKHDREQDKLALKKSTKCKLAGNQLSLIW